MNFLFTIFVFANSNIFFDTRRRLQTNPSVDDRVAQALSDDEHPEVANDLIFEISLSSGPSAFSRCRDAGLELCEKLGANDESISLSCNQEEFNYIGPEVILRDSTFACFRYVYSVKTGERESLEKIASAAESEQVKVISQLNREIRWASCETQIDAPWGLGFLDRHQQSATHSSTFRYDLLDGEGTVAYVVDTGIDSSHNDFEDRILGSENLVNPGVNGDYNGHGTHVAATIVGKNYGVAKRAKVYAINIFGRRETTNSMLVIAAIQRAYQRAKANKEKAVINLSVGGPANSAEDNAANAAVSNGITVVVASGNDGRDACLDSPGRARDVITVSSSDHYGFWSRYANHGSCVDIIAPGTSILSARSGTTDGNKRLTGTSMAAPHVAGVVLQIMSRNDISDPALVREHLLGADSLYSRGDVIFNVPQNTVNLALQSPCLSQSLHTHSPTHSPTSFYLPSLSPTDSFSVDSCFENECSPLKTCFARESGYDCLCPMNRSGDDCEIEYTPQRGCTCISMHHSSFGLIDSCTTRTDFPAWCYVEGNCAKTPSQHFEGYFWADCVEAPSPTKTPTFSIPTTNPSFSIPTKFPPASFPSIKPTYDSPTSSPSPSTILAPPVSVGYAAPEECYCVSVFHPNFGQIDSCTTETDFPAWCYVEGECAKTPSQTFPGKYWADCVVTVSVGTQVPITVSPTIMPTGFPSNVIPTSQPTAMQYLPAVRVLICQFASRSWQYRCCWKERGSFSEYSLYSEDCPAYNKLRFIHVPQGVQAILYDGSNFDGDSHVLQTGNYNVRPGWASSLVVQSTLTS